MPNKYLLLVLSIYLWTRLEPTHCTLIARCSKKSACSCLSSEGMIDLSPLATKGKPGLIAEDDSNIFYYNPCLNFDIGPLKDVGVVQYQKRYNLYYAIGDNDRASFSTVTGVLQLDLHDSSGKYATIVIECGSKVQFEYVIEFPFNHYSFRLTAPEGCPGYKPIPSVFQGLSPGSVLLIVSVVLICIYLAVGIAFQIFVNKANGIERIPNLPFWTELPGLIKDGVVFTFRTIRGKSVSYEKV